MSTFQRCWIYGRHQETLIATTVSVVPDFTGAIMGRGGGWEVEGKVVNQRTSHTRWKPQQLPCHCHLETVFKVHSWFHQRERERHMKNLLKIFLFFFLVLFATSIVSRNLQKEPTESPRVSQI